METYCGENLMEISDVIKASGIILGFVGIVALCIVTAIIVMGV